jgi:hypothetical protein
MLATDPCSSYAPSMPPASGPTLAATNPCDMSSVCAALARIERRLEASPPPPTPLPMPRPASDSRQD